MKISTDKATQFTKLAQRTTTKTASIFAQQPIFFGQKNLNYKVQKMENSRSTTTLVNTFISKYRQNGLNKPLY